MQPYNFSIGGNLPDPSQAFTSGMQQGNAVLQLDRQQQQQALEMQAQQQALRAQEQYSAAVNEVLAKPSGAGYARLMTLVPKEAEGLTKAWAALSAEKQQAGLSDLTQWIAAVENGRPDLAITAMNARADMIDRAAGGKSAEGEALRAQAKILEADPTTGARLVLAPMLYAHPDGKRALDNIRIQAGEARAAAKAPAELRTANAGASKAEADAKTAGVTAKFAESQALADLETKGWNIKALQADVDFKRQSSRIAAMNADLARKKDGREAEELKLKIGEARDKIDTAAREKVAEFDSRISGVTDARTLIKEIRDLRDSAWVNPTGLTATAAYMPGSNARAQHGKTEQLKNILALEYLDKLKGPTSDKDIAFLKNIGANLDSLQGDAAWAGELDKVDAALARVDAATRKKYGAPLAVVPSNPKPGAAPAAANGPTVSGW